MTAPIVHMVVGPERHGVVRFGLELNTALQARGVAVVECRAVDRAVIEPGRGVHLQFTDRLFGSDAGQAVDVVHRLIARVKSNGGRVSATLHDVPQPSDGINYTIRSRAYASLAAMLHGTVVGSEHEVDLLRDIGIRGRITIIPLPIATQAESRAEQGCPLSVGMFGFVYPGKGHDEVLAAMSGLPGNVAMVVIGEPSAGHEDLVDELASAAGRQARPFTMTGYVADGALVAQLQAVTVPVVHHRHVSASGSLNSWLAAGRRPLVSAGRYVREIAARNPGALWMYDDQQCALAAAIRHAIDEPSSTWLPAGQVCAPTPGQAAECYAALLRGVHG